VTIDLRHLRSFVLVAEEGNVGRAARRLFITQPALSRQLKQLEEELGVALFVRVPRGVELTEAGRELLVKARTALEAAEQAMTIGRPADPAGRLDVGVTLAAHRERWFGLAEAFARRHEAVDVELHTALSEVLQRRLAAGELDIAIVLEPVRLPGLSYAVVREEALAVWAHRDHPLAGREALTLTDLDGVAVTLLGGAGGSSSGFNARIRGLFADAGVEPVFVEASEPLPFNALRTASSLSLSVPVGFPEDVLRLRLLPERTMRYMVAHRAEDARASVRAFAAFAARHHGGAAERDAEPA
jgi:DNA-binding transcriptional LysR family regulator